MKIGSKAPKFKLASSEGTTVGLDAFVGKYVVIYFYPRDSTPGCTREAIAFRDAQSALEELGAVVVGVSRDSIASHCKFRDAHDLNFTLLSDPETSMISAYEAFGEKVLYGKKSLGIIRSTVVVGPDGKIVAHFPKVRVDGHADAVIAAIEADRTK